MKRRNRKQVVQLIENLFEVRGERLEVGFVDLPIRMFEIAMLK